MSNLLGLLARQKIESYRQNQLLSVAQAEAFLQYYGIKDGIVYADSINSWGNDRGIGRTYINETVHVSTVFLTIDHNFNFRLHEEYHPILFETMIFGGEYNESQWRYHTLSGAVFSHNFIVECLRRGIEPFLPPLRENRGSI